MLAGVVLLIWPGLLFAQNSIRSTLQANSASHAPLAGALHWTFRAPVRPIVPKVSQTGVHPQNPIDFFLLSALQRKGLTFTANADRRTLLRRVFFDLLGMPPTPAEVDAFMADRTPEAYERVVDRLLMDPRYGERWARHWLDTAGYADSEGILEEDRIRPNAWRYRDYVIRSLNSDKPYDRFLREQIAGDELTDYRIAEKWTPEIDEALTATGFLRTAVDATREDFNPHQFTEYQYRMLNDTQTILISSTLGITLQCARCHDHKYEPFSQNDYYRVQAILAGAIRPNGKLLPTNRRQIIAATAADQQRAATVNAQVTTAIQGMLQKEAAIRAAYRDRFLNSKLPSLPEADRAALWQAAHTEEGKRTPEQKLLAVKHKGLIEPPTEALETLYPDLKQQTMELQKARAEEEKRRLSFYEIRALYDQDAAPPATHLLIRGEWTRPGDETAPGIPAVLDDPRHPFQISSAAAGATTTGRRKALADWITRPDNPLTARVIVNRLWAQHFGVGIVASLDNFGRSGSLPSNAPLLDYLACELMHGVRGSAPWSLKAMQRLMVTSIAYRQASGTRAEAARRDPDDKLLWRQRPRRLEAEAIRDSMLAVTGTLDAALYGEPVGEEARSTGEIVPIGEEKGGRRSLYLQVRRSRPVTFLNTFDAPVIEINCTRRVVSTTATQALALLNSNFVDTQARHFAERIVKEVGAGEAGKSVLNVGKPDSVQGIPALANTSVKDSRSETANSDIAKKRIALGFRLAFGRGPTLKEETTMFAFLRTQTGRYMAAGKTAAYGELQALADMCLVLLSSNEFVYLD